MNILFFGDSVTQGCFEAVPTGEGFCSLRDHKSSYVSLVGQRLKTAYPDENIVIINAGVEGDSTSEGLARMEGDVLACHPDIVVVAFALNDACSRNYELYSKNIIRIFSTVIDSGARCLYMTPNMMNTYVAPDLPPCLIPAAESCACCQNDGSMDRLIELGKKIAKKCGVTVCDVYAAWKRLAYYGVDTTALLCNHINHPTREMHRLFSDLLYPHLSILISEKLTEADPSVYEESER